MPCHKFLTNPAGPWIPEAMAHQQEVFIYQLQHLNLGLFFWVARLFVKRMT